MSSTGFKACHNLSVESYRQHVTYCATVCPSLKNWAQFSEKCRFCVFRGYMVMNSYFSTNTYVYVYEFRYSRSALWLKINKKDSKCKLNKCYLLQCCSSYQSPQSLSPSHTCHSLIHRLVLAHLNSSSHATQSHAKHSHSKYRGFWRWNHG